MQRSLGPITVSTPGTPVAIASPSVPAQSILLQAFSNNSHTNTGRVYILVQRTKADTPVRVATLAIPTANTIPSFSATIPNATAGLDACYYYVDADDAGDGVDASYLVP